MAIARAAIVNVDRRPHSFEQSLRDGQPKARSVRFGCIKRFEDSIVLLGAQSGPRVCISANCWAGDVLGPEADSRLLARWTRQGHSRSVSHRELSRQRSEGHFAPAGRRTPSSLRLATASPDQLMRPERAENALQPSFFRLRLSAPKWKDGRSTT